MSDSVDTLSLDVSSIDKAINCFTISSILRLDMEKCLPLQVSSVRIVFRLVASLCLMLKCRNSI